MNGDDGYEAGKKLMPRFVCFCAILGPIIIELPWEVQSGTSKFTCSFRYRNSAFRCRCCGGDLCLASSAAVKRCVAFISPDRIGTGSPGRPSLF